MSASSKRLDAQTKRHDALLRGRSVNQRKGTRANVWGPESQVRGKFSHREDGGVSCCEHCAAKTFWFLLRPPSLLLWEFLFQPACQLVHVRRFAESFHRLLC